MYKNVLRKTIRIALLSLAGGTYKYLEDTGAFDGSTKLLQDGTVSTLSTLGTSADVINEMCTREANNIYPLAALGTAVGVWFLFDSIIDYDENGGIQFRIPVLIDRYIDA